MLQIGFKSRLNQLWDRFFNEGISNTVTAIEQLSYLFFIKWLEVNDNPHASIFTNSPLVIVNKTSGTLHVDAGKMRWSFIRQMNDTERVEHIAMVVFPWLKNESYTQHPFSQNMGNSVFLISRPSLLAEVMDVIESAFPEETSTSLEADDFWEDIGESYEFLLEKMNSVGKSSQVRTPADIAKLMCKLATPQPTDLVYDFACSSGDLLIAVRNYILEQYQSNLSKKNNLINLGEILNGADADRAMARIAMMNLMLHGIGRPKISVKDVSEPSTSLGKFSLVISSLPIIYGSYGINSQSINAPLQMELQYIYHAIDMLAINGKAILLIPENILSATDFASVELRKRLLQVCRLDAIISFPIGTIKQLNMPMAILTFSKILTETAILTSKKWSTENIWMYQTIGDDVDLVSDAFLKKKPEQQADLHKNHFIVPLQAVLDNNFSLNIQHYQELEIKSQIAAVKQTTQPNVLPINPPTPQIPTQKNLDNKAKINLNIKDDDIAQVGSTLQNLLSTYTGTAKESPLAKSISDLLVSILPKEKRQLRSELGKVTASEIVGLMKGFTKKGTSLSDSLVDLLQAKKNQADDAKEKMASTHPFHQLLSEACNIENLVSGDVNINLLSLAQKSKLQEFSILQLLSCVNIALSPLPPITEELLELELQAALMRFVVKAEAAFTFQTLQKVLAQLQFLPSFNVLRNFVWANLANKQLKQFYVSKEYNNNIQTKEDAGFELFNPISGNIHLVDAGKFQTIQNQLL